MLPEHSIGTIVRLRGGERFILIIGLAKLILADSDDLQRTYYTYEGALYPQGLEGAASLFFNNEDIEQVIFEGYQDNAFDAMNERINRFIVEHAGEFVIGKVK
jgi:hypothetical protein